MFTTKTIFTAGLAVAAAAIGPAPAVADDGATTRQALADNAAFLAHVPAPPSGAAAACFVDSGLSITPDTSDAILTRTSIDPDQAPDDTLGQVGDGTLAAHGTLVVTAAFGAINGWGTRGYWPAGRAVSVNGLPVGEHRFPVASYSRGIKRCLGLAADFDIKVISLALGGPGPITGEELALLENAVGAAHGADINVVAAGGNVPGPIEVPAAYSPIFAVLAGDPTRLGSLCDFASSGPEGDLALSGCHRDATDPLTGEPAKVDGSSPTDGQAVAVLVALRSLRPDLSWSDAETLLTSTARAGHVDVAAAFAAAGLGDVVTAAEAIRQLREPAPAPAPPAEQPPVATVVTPVTTPTRRAAPAPAVRRWPRPSARFSRRGRFVQMTLKGRPANARAVVTVERLGEAGWARLAEQRVVGSRARIEIRRSWQRNRFILRLKVVYQGGSARSASQPAISRIR